ncbi:MAG TPA: hypothetical protein VM802_02700 [Chitinophaga sp.]|uniref:hypothetical protein n=1 Tax=Chitinophaga sp. TaxID=1869181 RepID=UPI002CAEE29D|nr:hypothetical protein [Chitinophaga sp.]HVI43746.1 hypothetical protein [Chitinophaga sp.]
MATATGPVNCVLITTGVSYVSVQDTATNRAVPFILWNSLDGQPSSTWEIENMWVSMLKDARNNGKVVTVNSVSDTSAIISSVQI